MGWYPRRSYQMFAPPQQPVLDLGPYAWPYKIFDHRDRFVIGSLLRRRGWAESKWCFKLLARDQDKLAGAERELADAAWTQGALSFWSEADLYVNLNVLKLPGKRQQDPAFWEANPDAPAEAHYALALELTGLITVPGTPAVATYAKLDWKGLKAPPGLPESGESDAVTSGQRNPYEEKPHPELIGWRIRTVKEGSNGSGKYYASKAAGTIVHDQVSPFIKTYVGLIRANEPLGTLLDEGIDKACCEAVERIHQVLATKVDSRASRFVAKKVREEIT